MNTKVQLYMDCIVFGGATDGLFQRREKADAGLIQLTRPTMATNGIASADDASHSTGICSVLSL